MKRKTTGGALAIASALLAYGFTGLAVATDPSNAPVKVRVLISGGFAPAYARVAPGFANANGLALETTQAPSMGSSPASISSRLANDEFADVVILDATALDTLIADGKVDAWSRVVLAGSGIGVAIPSGQPAVKVGTIDALRKLLLQAPCIAVSASGSGRYVSGELLDKLGIADQVKDRLMVSSKAPVAELLADGRCDVGLQQISELRAAPGITFVGPLPSAVQKTTVFAAGIPTNALSPAAGAGLIRELASPRHGAELRAVGLEPAVQGEAP